VLFRSKDDNLDTAAWVPFADGQPGMLILFAQCKTGTSWREMTTQLQPDAFINKWMSGKVLVKPVRAFCVSEALHPAQQKGWTAEAGILFDRCRLVDFGDAVSPALLTRMEAWTTAARTSEVSRIFREGHS